METNYLNHSSNAHKINSNWVDCPRQGQKYELSTACIDWSTFSSLTKRRCGRPTKGWGRSRTRRRRRWGWSPSRGSRGWRRRRWWARGTWARRGRWCWWRGSGRSGCYFWSRLHFFEKLFRCCLSVVRQTSRRLLQKSHDTRSFTQVLFCLQTKKWHLVQLTSVLFWLKWFTLFTTSSMKYIEWSHIKTCNARLYCGKQRNIFNAKKKKWLQQQEWQRYPRGRVGTKNSVSYSEKIECTTREGEMVFCVLTFAFISSTWPDSSFSRCFASRVAAFSFSSFCITLFSAALMSSLWRENNRKCWRQPRTFGSKKVIFSL